MSINPVEIAESYMREGYAIVRGLFSASEIETLGKRWMASMPRL